MPSASENSGKDLWKPTTFSWSADMRMEPKKLVGLFRFFYGLSLETDICCVLMDRGKKIFDIIFKFPQVILRSLNSVTFHRIHNWVFWSGNIHFLILQWVMNCELQILFLFHFSEPLFEERLEISRPFSFETIFAVVEVKWGQDSLRRIPSLRKFTFNSGKESKT